MRKSGKSYKCFDVSCKWHTAARFRQPDSSDILGSITFVPDLSFLPDVAVLLQQSLSLKLV